MSSNNFDMEALYPKSMCERLIILLSLVSCLAIIGCSSAPDSAENKPAEEIVEKTNLTEDAFEDQACLPSDAKTRFQLAAPNTSTNIDNTRLNSILNLTKNICSSCHEAPKQSIGGFSYVQGFADAELVNQGAFKNYPGIYSSAEKMLTVLELTDDERKAMPPAYIRNASEESRQSYELLRSELTEWIKEGKPEFEAKRDPIASDADWGMFGQQRTLTELGNCIPKKEIVGTDPDKDQIFAELVDLPKKLSETDLYTLDSEELAKKGTVAYNVEYPLWSDDNKKQRYIHLPVNPTTGKIQKIGKFESESGDPMEWNLPENTRFYKTFYAGTKKLTGEIHYRPIETRVIVVRYGDKKPIHGTYVWNEDYSDAMLLEDPYRDGTKWVDRVIEYTLNEKENINRKYIVPAKHRCEQCHMGAENKSDVLGFSPIQINRRFFEGDTKAKKPISLEGIQADRLIEYGMLDPDAKFDDFKIETIESNTEKNKFSLEAQAYVIGNCAHCHNPAGYAKEKAKVSFDFRAGKLFDFNTYTKSVKLKNLKIVHHEGDLENSYLYMRMGEKDHYFAVNKITRMPMHTPGSPNCESVEKIARWILSYNKNLTEKEIEEYAFKDCQRDPFSKPDFKWVSSDPTFLATDYKPKRQDWDTETGMPEKYFDLKLSAKLDKISKTSYPVQYWRKKRSCDFPKVDSIPEEFMTPWIQAGLESESPRKTLELLYWSTPGQLFFTSTCVKCHGRSGKGDGDLAEGLSLESGGNITVANFPQGMFGDDGKNLENFNSNRSGTVQNFAGQYFIWMAMEGTNLNPPESLRELLGKHQAQMLKQIRDRCIRLIPTAPAAMRDYYQEYAVYKQVCSSENLDIDHPSIQYEMDEQTQELVPVNEEALNKWADKATQNAGWTIYNYVKDELSKGKTPVLRTECDKR